MAETMTKAGVQTTEFFVGVAKLGYEKVSQVTNIAVERGIKIQAFLTEVGKNTAKWSAEQIVSMAETMTKAGVQTTEFFVGVAKLGIETQIQFMKACKQHVIDIPGEYIAALAKNVSAWTGEKAKLLGEKMVALGILVFNEGKQQWEVAEERQREQTRVLVEALNKTWQASSQFGKERQEAGKEVLKNTVGFNSDDIGIGERTSKSMEK
jgi:hypothetical protein